MSENQSNNNQDFKNLLSIKDWLNPTPREHYRNYRFQVGSGTVMVGAKLSYNRKHHVQIYISLHDPNGFRGNRMNLSKYGFLETELWVGFNSASQGGISGPIPSGEWHVQIDIDFLNEPTEINLVVFACYGKVPSSNNSYSFPEGHVISSDAGWYRGELHCHSNESDGQYSVEQTIKAAQVSGLDFLALTDHFTTSQWDKLGRLVKSTPMALLRSCEITSHHGHANIHGLKKRVDVYVDREDYSMNDAADAVHLQNGLFCVNHPYSGELSWRDFHFDWSKADLIEIYNPLEGPNNQQQICLWDFLLLRGYRLIGIGGTDSHNIILENHALSKLVTNVHSYELSEKGIINGLKMGNVFVSRGAELHFCAYNCLNEHVVMGARITSYSQPVTFYIKYRASCSLRCFIYKDGLFWNSLSLKDSNNEWCSVKFTTHNEAHGVFRVELHKLYDHPNYPGIEWHDFNTVQALSNPIWVD